MRSQYTYDARYVNRSTIIENVSASTLIIFAFLIIAKTHAAEWSGKFLLLVEWF